MKCPQCGFENPTNNKFCGECGFNLRSYSSIERMELLKKSIPDNLVKKIISTKHTAAKERRNVTVVFADISGFTSLSEKLDPEELTALMNECFQKLGLMVYRYEGIIDKFIGDCIMAIFGAPVSHEDDPERAILSSIDMQAALDEINRKSGDKVTELQIHIGVNTGEVIAGRVGSDLQMEYTVMGDTVNVAQRLKDVAAPGTILVGPETYHRTKHAFDFIQLEPIQLKGKEELITPFEVIGKRWGSEYGLGSFRSNLVGREQELNQLKSAASDSIEQSRVFFIKGEIGVGKSRLLYELKKFLTMSAQNIAILDTRGISYESLIPYKAFSDCLRRYLLAGSKIGEDTRSVIEKVLKSLLREEYEATGAYIFKLLNLTLNETEQSKIEFLDAHTLQLQILLATASLFEKIAQQNRLVLIIDDIQWLDSGSIEILNFLLPLLKKSKMVFLLSYRTSDSKQIEKFLDNISSAYSDIIEKITLENLSYEASMILIENLLGKDIDENMKKHLFQRSSGNPFFIEEIARQIVETGMLDKKKPLALEQIELPGSIETVVTARYDALSKEAKYLLKIGSIIGRSFPKTLLETVVSEKEILGYLDELETAELFVRINHENSICYTFRHPIFQEVAYRSLLRSERVIYHKIIAEAIESKFLKVIGGSANLLAHHYYECKQFSKAATYAIQAGDESASLFANEEAIKNYELAASIAEKEEIKAEALEKLADVLFLKSAEVSQILNLYDQAKALIGDDLLKAKINGKIARVHWRSGRLDSSIQILRSTIKDIENSDSIVLANLAYQLSDALLESKSETEQAEQYVEYGMRIANRLNDKEAEIFGMRMKAQILWRKGKGDAALKILLDCESEYEKLPDLQSRASFYILTGSVYRALGNLKKAIEYCKKSNDISQQIGNQRFLSLGYNNIGIYYELSGDVSKGLEYYQKSLAIRMRLGDRRGEAISTFNIGTLKARIGEKNQALEYFKQALRTAKEIADIRAVFNCLLAIANTYIDNGEYSTASKYLEDAESIAEQKHEALMQCEILYFRSRSYLQANDTRKAKEYVLKTLDLEATIASKELLSRSYSLLAEILLKENDIQAVHYAQESLKITQSSNEKHGEINALRILGMAQAILADDSRTGIKNIKQAITLAKESGLMILYADGLMALARVMIFEKNNKLAENYLMQAKRIYTDLDYQMKLKEINRYLEKIHN